jgi:predicted nucleic acid-binding protein
MWLPDSIFWFALLEEPQGLDDVLRKLVQNGITPRLWTDAYLAAFAIAGGRQFITFDQDFMRFEGLSYVLL